VKTRSSAQIRSHAQKYIIKLCKKFNVQDNKQLKSFKNIKKKFNSEFLGENFNIKELHSESTDFSDINMERIEERILGIFKSSPSNTRKIFPMNIEDLNFGFESIDLPDEKKNKVFETVKEPRNKIKKNMASNKVVPQATNNNFNYNPNSQKFNHFGMTEEQMQMVLSNPGNLLGGGQLMMDQLSQILNLGGAIEKTEPNNLLNYLLMNGMNGNVEINDALINNLYKLKNEENLGSMGALNSYVDMNNVGNLGNLSNFNNIGNLNLNSLGNINAINKTNPHNNLANLQNSSMPCLRNLKIPDVQTNPQCADNNMLNEMMDIFSSQMGNSKQNLPINNDHIIQHILSGDYNLNNLQNLSNLQALNNLNNLQVNVQPTINNNLNNKENSHGSSKNIYQIININQGVQANEDESVNGMEKLKSLQQISDIFKLINPNGDLNPDILSANNNGTEANTNYNQYLNNKIKLENTKRLEENLTSVKIDKSTQNIQNTISVHAQSQLQNNFNLTKPNENFLNDDLSNMNMLLNLINASNNTGDFNNLFQIFDYNNKKYFEAPNENAEEKEESAKNSQNGCQGNIFNAGNLDNNLNINMNQNFSNLFNDPIMGFMNQYLIQQNPNQHQLNNINNSNNMSNLKSTGIQHIDTYFMNGFNPNDYYNLDTNNMISPPLNPSNNFKTN
jgi:hypothetical protein